MQTRFDIPRTDQGVELVTERLHEPLQTLSLLMCGDYGGDMEHLWVDMEISPSHADLRPEPWPFRFQKRMAQGSLIDNSREHLNNVGHYSFRPDLLNVPLEQVVSYALNELYESTAILERCSTRLTGFDVEKFRADLAREVARLSEQEE